MSPLTRQLRLVTAADNGLPAEVSLQVAFATSDRHCVDQHFGAARCIVVYEVEAGAAHLLRVSEFTLVEQDGDDGKLQCKLRALQGCRLVYCTACGASALRRLVGAGVQPVKVAVGVPITRLLEQLQQVLRDGKPFWKGHGALPRDEGRFDAMEREGWCP